MNQSFALIKLLFFIAVLCAVNDSAFASDDPLPNTVNSKPPITRVMSKIKDADEIGPVADAIKGLKARFERDLKVNFEQESNNESPIEQAAKRLIEFLSEQSTIKQQGHIAQERKLQLTSISRQIQRSLHPQNTDKFIAFYTKILTGSPQDFPACDKRGNLLQLDGSFKTAIIVIALVDPAPEKPKQLKVAASRDIPALPQPSKCCWGHCDCSDCCKPKGACYEGCTVWFKNFF